MARKNKKEQIFEESVRLFSGKGYAETSIRQIAAAAIVNEATIYTHFKSKADILDEILDVFENKLKRILPDKKRIDSYMREGNTQKLLGQLVWNDIIYADIFMTRAFRIMCMEQFTNEKAGALVRELLHNKAVENIRYALSKLAENGEMPEFDIYLFSVLWAQAMFSSATLKLQDESAEGSKHLRALGELMMDMAVSGKVPRGNGSVLP